MKGREVPTASTPPVSQRLRGLHHLPGRILLEPGVWADYKSLAHLHYRTGHPQCPVAVMRAVHEYETSRRTVGVCVLCYPSLRCRPRETFFGVRPADSTEAAPFVNANLRVVRRVLIHPQFRGIGLATGLIRETLATSPTRYTEALAVMGNLLPMFERAGMTRLTPTDHAGPAYFLHDAAHSTPKADR